MSKTEIRTVDNRVLEFLGVDYGTKVVGIARINTFAKIGEPLEPLRPNNFHDAVYQLQVLCTDSIYDGVVVGLPRNLDGNDTPQTKDVRSFALEVKKALKISVYLVDEAGSTLEAKSRIGKNRVSLDSMSAVVILENFLSHGDKKSLEVEV